MQVSDKLIKPLTEAKYLNADNVSRYRCIMRIFFEHYEKLKYWLYQEEVWLVHGCYGLPQPVCALASQ